MIRLIEALNYRCLRYVRQPLGPFHVLVGPNASGKTTFLDVLGLLADIANDGVEEAVARRSANVYDLMWGRQGTRFELAVEAVVPEGRLPAIDTKLTNEGYAIRYEIAVGLEAEGGKLAILDEQVLVAENYQVADGDPGNTPETLVSPSSGRSNWKRLMTRVGGANMYALHPEVRDWELAKRLGDGGYSVAYRATSRQPVFQAMPQDQFPSAVWLENLLKERLTTVDLDSSALKRTSKPGQGARLVSSGENLPWLIEGLRTRQPEQYNDWIGHLRTALPDVEGLRIVDKPEDRHSYIMVQYRGGLEVPSWMVSDGTLRLIALTFLAYASDAGAVYQIEEPETHIHPLNIEVAMQSLSSVYGGQVLVATHSPAILAMTDASKVLVFSRDGVLGARIVPGNEHPRLRDWKGEVSLGTLFASGVLG